MANATETPPPPMRRGNDTFRLYLLAFPLSALRPRCLPACCYGNGCTAVAGERRLRRQLASFMCHVKKVGELHVGRSAGCCPLRGHVRVHVCCT